MSFTRSRELVDLPATYSGQTVRTLWARRLGKWHAPQRRVARQNAEVAFFAGRDDRRHWLGENFARGRKNINL